MPERRLLRYLALATLCTGVAHAQQGSITSKLVSYEGELDVIRGGIPLALYPDLPMQSGDLVRTSEQCFGQMQLSQRSTSVPRFANGLAAMVLVLQVPNVAAFDGARH